MPEFPQPEGTSAVLPYMVPCHPQTHQTDEYVSSPPALVIIDERGAYWALGLRYQQLRDAPQGEYAFNCLRNGQDTGIFASRIERRHGKIRVFTKQGWKVWNGRSFV